MKKPLIFLVMIFSCVLIFSQSIPSSLYGIWEGKDRIVFFEEIGADGALSGEGAASGSEAQIVVLLKEYYGWYYDRAVEPEEYGEKEPRTRNSGTTKKAQQVYFDVKNLKDGENWSFFELETELSRRQKNLIPVLLSDDKIYLDFYIQNDEDRNIFTGHAKSEGITMYEQKLPENIGLLYLTADGGAAYDLRYWKSDMDFEASQVLFKRPEGEFYVPKHLVSRGQNYSSVSGRSKIVRNPQVAMSLESRGFKFTGKTAFDSPFIIADKEPYLVRIADKKTFEDLMKIVKEANSRRKPDPPALFPPHDPPLDWHWDVIDLLERNNPYIQKVRERQKNFGARAKDMGR